MATTLTALLKEAAAAFPARRAVAVPGKLELTHAALDALVDAAAARLAVDAGVLPGHVVALAFPNTVEVRLLHLSNSIDRSCSCAAQPCSGT
jgi:acyl-CoA synthetase (AMP-forming)/AMP-acid ligase II